MHSRKFGLRNTPAQRAGDVVCVLSGKKVVECHMGKSPGVGGAGTWNAGREALQSQGPGQPALSLPLLAKGQTLPDAAHQAYLHLGLIQT